MELAATLSVTPIYIAILGLLFIPFTMRAGFYRVKAKINIGTGDDPELLRRVRGQANFTETVPIALFLIVTMELMGASATWLHALGALLVFGRLTHYLGITEIGPGACRPIGMSATMFTVLISSVWILVAVL